MKKINEIIFNIFIVLIVIGLYVCVALFIYTSFRERKRQEMTHGVIDMIDEQIKEYEKVKEEYDDSNNNEIINDKNYLDNEDSSDKKTSNNKKPSNNKQNNNEGGNVDITETKIVYNGKEYTALGKIKISKINIYEPILKENTKDSYNVAPVKLAGNNLNEKGNVVIGGHNYMKKDFFIKIKKLRKNDVITITNLKNQSVKYYVYDYGVTTVSDTSYLDTTSNDKIITLVTCTSGGKERYYVRAKAK